MKFLRSILLAAAAALPAALAFGQSTISHVGITAGVARTVLSGQINTESFFKTGFTGGLVFHIRPSESFAFQPELLYAQQGVSNGLSPSSTEPDYDINLNYVSMPLLAKFYAGKFVNLQIGPQFGVLLSARQVGNVYSTTSPGTKVAVDRDVSADYGATFGLCGGVGVDFPFGLMLSGRVTYGLSDINENRDQAAIRSQFGFGGLKNRSFELMLGYLIGAKK